MRLKTNKNRKRPSQKKNRAESQVKPSFKGGLRILGAAVFFGSGLFALIIGFELIGTLPVFEVREIRWVGLNHLKEDVMKRGVQPLFGKNIFHLNIQAVQRRLLANPWIKEATVKKVFPARLLVIVKERKPASVEYDAGKKTGEIVNLSIAPYLVDEEGVTLQQGGPYPPHLPRLINVNKAGYAAALSLGHLVKGRPNVFIDLFDPHNLRVYFMESETKTQIGLLHLGEAQYQKKWHDFLNVEADLEQRGLESWEIDLRVPGKAIVKTGGGKLNADTLYF